MLLESKMKLEDEIFQKKFKNEYHKAVVNLIFTYNWMRDFQVNTLKPFDITMQQFNILRILRGQHPNPANIKLIRERMLDKMSDCSRIVEKLRIKGLIERTTCETDRRHVDVVITDKGLKVLSKLDKYNDQVESHLSSLTNKEVTELNRLLDKLRG